MPASRIRPRRIPARHGQAHRTAAARSPAGWTPAHGQRADRHLAGRCPAGSRTADPRAAAALPGLADRNPAPADRSRARPARVTRWRATAPARRTTPALRTALDPRMTPGLRTASARRAIVTRRPMSPGGAVHAADCIPGSGSALAAGLARTAPAHRYALARPAPPAGPAARRGRPMGLVSCCVSGRSSRYDRTYGCDLMMNNAANRWRFRLAGSSGASGAAKASHRRTRSLRSWRQGGQSKRRRPRCRASMCRSRRTTA